MLPDSWLPNNWPCVATVSHKNGKSSRRRTRGSSFQYLRLSSSSAAQLPPASVRSKGSAPVKTSCQRTPSAITRMTFCVFAAHAADVPQTQANAMKSSFANRDIGSLQTSIQPSGTKVSSHGIAALRIEEMQVRRVDGEAQPLAGG